MKDLMQRTIDNITKHHVKILDDFTKAYLSELVKDWEEIKIKDICMVQENIWSWVRWYFKKIN